MSSRQEISVLFLGGAKRVSLARHLRKAFEKAGYGMRLFSYELEERMPIAAEGEIIIGRRWKDADIFEDLLRNIRRHDIRLMLPFVDGAVEIAARFMEKYPDEGLCVPGTHSPELAAVMFDKVRSDAFFRSLGLPVPPAFAEGEKVSFPLIAKPRCGSASRGIQIIRIPEEWSAMKEKDNYLFQKYISDAEELSADCYVGLRSGRILVCSVRRRLETLGGEAVRSITIDDPDALALARETLRLTGLRGAVTIQMLRPRSEEDSPWMLMEINPRLGGGVVCSIGAGADIPGMIVADTLGLPEPDEAQPRAGTEMVRFFDEVIFH